MADMKMYHGSCHCGRVKFEFDSDLTAASECNCSICRKKGALHHRVPRERLRITSGGDELVLYQFNTKQAKHYFCRHCGIHPFSHPRIAPDAYSVNLRCLDDDFNLDDLEIRIFDGRNWEETVARLKAASQS